jgi:hypothetical protein
MVVSMLTLALLLLASPRADGSPLARAVAEGDAYHAELAIDLLLGEAREVAVAGGDGEAWMAAGLEEEGLSSVRFEVRVEPELGLEGPLRFSSCRARPSVICSRDAFAVEECSEVSANIRCVSEQVVPEGAPGLSATCGGRSLRAERLSSGRVELSGLDRCWEAGSLDVSMGRRSDARVASDVESMALLRASSVLYEAFGSGVVSGEDFDGALDESWEHDGLGSGGVRGVTVADDWGAGGGGGGGTIGVGRLGVDYTPPPPEPWRPWSAVRPLGEPIPSSATRVAIAGDEILAIDGENLIRIGLEDGVERGRIELRHHSRGRQVDDVCVSPDSSSVAVVWGSVGLDTDGGGYELWTLGAKPAILIDEGTRWSSHRCAFTADGRWLAVGTREGLRIWDAQRGLLVRSAGHDGDQLDQVRLLTPAPADARLLLLWHSRRLVSLDAGSGERVEFGDFDEFILDAAWLEGDLFAFAAGGTRLWRPGRGEVARGPGDGLLLEPLGENLLVSTERGPLVLDASAEALGGLGGPARRPESFAVSADGTRIVVATWEGLLRYRVVSE